MGFKSIIKFAGENAEALIALSALGLAILNGMIQRYHNRLTVKPHLSFIINVSNISPQIQIHLSNTGTGPAVIKKFSVLLDGKYADKSPNTTWDSIIKQLDIPTISGRVVPPEGFNDISGGGMIFYKDEAIQAESMHDIFYARVTEEEKCPTLNANAAHKELERIQVIIEFESVYKDFQIVKLHKT